MKTKQGTSKEFIERYRRQMVLEDWGPATQDHLRDVQVMVVGCGGLGAPVIQYLAAAGVGHLTLVDDDQVQRSNLNRQTLFGTHELHHAKTEAAGQFVRALNPEVQVTLKTERLGPHNGRSWVAGHDLVFDCTDGLPNKYLLNDICILEKIPLMHGAVSAWAGQLMCIEPGESACLRCAFPRMPAADSVPSCQTVGILGAACALVGSQMALWGLRRLAPNLSWPAGKLWALDLKTDRRQELNVKADQHCRVCGQAAHIDGRSVQDYERGL